MAHESLKRELPLKEETREIVDRLLDEFLPSCVGKNDMSMASAFMVSAVIIVVAHCKRTGDDYLETIAMAHDVFEAAALLFAEKFARETRK